MHDNLTTVGICYECRAHGYPAAEKIRLPADWDLMIKR